MLKLVSEADRQGTRKVVRKSKGQVVSRYHLRISIGALSPGVGDHPFLPFKCILMQSSNNGDVGNRGMTRVGITNYFVNTIVTALKAPEWETLLERYVNSCGAFFIAYNT